MRTKLKRLPDKETVKEKWNIYHEINLDTIREDKRESYRQSQS